VKCATHPEAEASGMCVNCGKAVCPDCSNMISKKTYCSHCADDYDNVKASAAPAPQQIVINQSASASSSAAAAGPAVGGYQIKNPGMAALFSFLIVGGGQLYNGQVGKGILMFVACVLLWFVFLGWIINIWSIFDAYNQAKMINARGW
jgi:TM2 domain-containing membrane protein YozV